MYYFKIFKCFLNNVFLQGLDIKYIHKYNVKVSCDLKTMLYPFDTINKDFSSIQFVTYKKDIVGERLVQDSSPK